MRKPENPTIQLAFTASSLNLRIKAKEQDALIGRRTITRPMPRHIEAVIR